MKSRALANAVVTQVQIARARFRRWLYLLFIGMWRGECAISTYTLEGDFVALASSTPDGDEYRVWWARP